MLLKLLYESVNAGLASTAFASHPAASAVLVIRLLEASIYGASCVYCLQYSA